MLHIQFFLSHIIFDLIQQVGSPRFTYSVPACATALVSCEPSLFPPPTRLASSLSSLTARQMCCGSIRPPPPPSPVSTLPRGGRRLSEQL